MPTSNGYVWLTRRALLDAFVEELSIIMPAHIEALGKALEPWRPAPVIPKIRIDPTAPPVSDKRMLACAKKVLSDVVAKLSARRDSRNIGLHNAARRLGKLVHNGMLGEGEVRSALIEACNTNGSWNVHGAKQCHWTISSGFSRARRFGDELPALRDRPTMAAH